MIRTALGVALAAVGTLASAQTAPSSLLPGAWQQQFTFQVKRFDGQPAPPMAPDVETETDCYTDQDVADPRRILLAGAEQACAISDFTMKNGELSFSARCTFQPGVTASGNMRGTYNSTSFELHGILTSAGNDPLELETSMSARRVGICKK